MSEAEVVTAFATLGQAFLAGLQAAFAIISAYIVALYFFLGRAPLVMRIVAFAFFSSTLAVLGLYLAGAKAYGDGIAVALAEMQDKTSLSTLGKVVLWLINDPQAYLLLYASLGIGLTAYLTLFYLTFFYNWKDTKTVDRT